MKPPSSGLYPCSSRIALCVVTAVVLSLMVLKFAPVPYLWICLIWCVLSLYGMRWVRTEVRCIILLNCGIVLATLGAFEFYFWIIYKAKDVTLYSEGYKVADPYLGNRPARGVRATGKRLHGQEVIYDVTYSIGSNGLRIAPPDKGAAIYRCVLFFGCSVTFGVGVQDTETMPWRVGIRGDGDLRVFNFGFNAYGPHHMLSALEHGLVDSAVNCTPTDVIYTAIPDHIARVAGLGMYVGFGPHYTLLPYADGDVEFRGLYSAKRSRNMLVSLVRDQLSKSWAFRYLFALRRPYIEDRDLQLYLAVVKKAGSLIKSKYPGAKFYILIWPEGDERLDSLIVTGLRKVAPDVHLILTILPDYRFNKLHYVLAPSDDHPNAVAHDAVAKYIVEEMLATQ